MTSPPLRTQYLRNKLPKVNADLTVYQIWQKKTAENREQGLEDLLKLISLFGNHSIRRKVTLRSMLDKFETIMQDSRTRHYISPLMASLISQLSIISECLSQLHLFQPWAHRVEQEIARCRPQLLLTFEAEVGIFVRLGSLDLGVNKLFKLVNPRNGKFHYPVDELRTKAVVDRMRAAEKALDSFWQAANAHWLRNTGSTPFTVVKHIMGDRKLARAPAWIQSGTSENSAIAEAKPASRLAVHFLVHLHDATKDVTGTFAKVPISSKTKVKTRGLTTVEPVPAVVNDVPSLVVPTRYTVDHRAFQIFRTLFFTPNAQDQSGEVTWPDFLHAMVSVGFGAEKIEGSAWHFTPDTLAAERSIQFHEPHPGNKLAFKKAKRYGRRLTIAFGWTGDSFELA